MSFKCNGNLEDCRRISYFASSWFILKAQPETGKSLHMSPDSCSSEKWHLGQMTHNVCFALKPNHDHSWQTAPPSCSQACLSPHNCFFIEIILPTSPPLNCCIRVGAPTFCHRPAGPPHSPQTSSWLRWALTRRKKTRARGWNMAAITNRKTSGKGGPCKLTAAASQWKHWWVKSTKLKLSERTAE